MLKDTFQLDSTQVLWPFAPRLLEKKLNQEGLKYFQNLLHHVKYNFLVEIPVKRL